jgi:hypothetical protein
MFNLTKRMLDVLAMMQAAKDREDYEAAEIVKDGGACWLGQQRISPRTVNSLLHLMALRESNDGGACRRYTINSVGSALLRRPELRDEIIGALLKGGSWTIQNDKLVII